MKTCIFDIETNDLLDKVTKFHCGVIIDVDTEAVESFRPHEHTQFLSRLDEFDRIVGHNIQGFDIPCLTKLFGWEPKEDVEVYDTLIMSPLVWSDIKSIDFQNKKFPGHLAGRHSLEAWGHRLGVHKGDYGKQENAWEKFTEAMLLYCIDDVKLNLALYHRIESKNPSTESRELEHRFRKLMDRQERNGVGFDQQAALELTAKLEKKREVLAERLKEFFPDKEIEMKTPAYWTTPDGERWPTKKAALNGGHHNKEIVRGPNRVKVVEFNPQSPVQIVERLTAEGWTPVNFTPKGNPKVDEESIKLFDHPAVPSMMEYLLIDKRLGMLATGPSAWLKLEKDGKIHGRVMTNGTVSGRCSHIRPNCAQVPAVRSPYGKACRSLFGPTRPGWVQVGADASGLELRNLGGYLAPHDGGRYADIVCDGDIHTENQKAAGLPTRDHAKRFCYAFIYGAGDELIGSMVSDSKERTTLVREGKKIRERFLKAIEGLEALTNGVKRASGFKPRESPQGVFWSRDKKAKKTWLKGLDGRVLPVRSAHAALNLLLQSAGAVLMKRAAVIFADEADKRGIPWEPMLNVHDEIQVECPPEHAQEVGELMVQSIRDAGTYYNFRCPLDGEYKIGKNWAETH